LSVSIDLGDPVQVILDIIKANISEEEVEVAPGFTRGGYAKPHPRFIPVEGEVKGGRFIRRKGQTNLKDIPAKAEVVVYEVNDSGDEADTICEKYGDVKVRVSVDIYHIQSRARFRKLYHEIVRCIYKSRTDPGGNYSYIKRLQRTDLSNRQAGFWRYTQDYELVKTSDYFGHS
jgi:hypothetical protein